MWKASMFNQFAVPGGVCRAHPGLVHGLETFRQGMCWLMLQSKVLGRRPTKVRKVFVSVLDRSAAQDLAVKSCGAGYEAGRAAGASHSLHSSAACASGLQQQIRQVVQ